MRFEQLPKFATLTVRQQEFVDPGLYAVSEIGFEGLYLVTPTDISLFLPASSGGVGPQGPQGAQGFPGTDGLDGDEGPVGSSGPPGAAGAAGSTGPAGQQGPIGVPGFDGLDGDDGANGLPGAPGATGATGSPGSAGAQGLQGMPGFDGDDGVPGDNGPPGPQGPQGIAGTNCADGAPGAAGAQGSQGIPGFDGVDGEPGDVGSQGPIGPQGAAGTNGTNGSPGPTGPSGLPGLPSMDGLDIEIEPHTPLGTSWLFPGANGPVSGPAGATDNAIARYDGTTGELIQNSLVTIDDTGIVTTPTTVIAALLETGTDLQFNGSTFHLTYRVGDMAGFSNNRQLTLRFNNADRLFDMWGDMTNSISPTQNITLGATSCAYFPDSLELAASASYEIGAGAVIEVG